MTDTIKISRELAEQICVELEHDNDRYMLGRELRKALATPPADAAALREISAEFRAMLAAAPAKPAAQQEQGDEVCDVCDGKGYVNVGDGDAQVACPFCDLPAAPTHNQAEKGE